MTPIDMTITILVTALFVPWTTIASPVPHSITYVDFDPNRYTHPHSRSATSGSGGHDDDGDKFKFQVGAKYIDWVPYLCGNHYLSANELSYDLEPYAHAVRLPTATETSRTSGPPAGLRDAKRWVYVMPSLLTGVGEVYFYVSFWEGRNADGVVYELDTVRQSVTSTGKDEEIACRRIA